MIQVRKTRFGPGWHQAVRDDRTTSERRTVFNRLADMLRAKALRAKKAKNARKWRRHAAQMRKAT